MTVLTCYKSLQTFLGKIMGGLCALVGVFTITLPIPIIVNSFAGFYKARLWRTEVAQKKRERIHEKEEADKLLGPDSQEVGGVWGLGGTITWFQ